MTPQENYHHSLIVLNNIERIPRGGQHWRTTLNDQQVREIKQLLAEGNLLQREIAQLYAVSDSTIEHIKAGNSWRHVTVE